MKDNIETINEWAEQFAYHQLDSDKQATVLAEMSIEQYDELHQTIKVFAGFLHDESQDLEPNKGSLATLQKAQSDSKKPVGILAIRIPAYQAVAACFLVFMTMFLLQNRGDKTPLVVEKEVPVFEVIRDTIYREVPVIEYITRTIVKEVPVVEERNELIVTSYIPEEDYSLSQPVEVPSMEDISKSFGNTVVDAEILERFKVGM